MWSTRTRLSARRWLKHVTLAVALSSSFTATLTGCGEIEGEGELAEVHAVRNVLRADETVIAAESVPYGLRARAATLVEQRRQLGEFEGARLGEKAFVYFRPDVEGPAYYEFEVLREGEPSGFVLVSTGRHDHPVAHWSAEGEAMGRQLTARAEGAITRLYKLDVLSYAAEGVEGEVVAQLGNLPQRQYGLDHDSEANLVHHRAEPVASDPDAEDGVRFELTSEGEDPQSLVIEPFERFEDLKAEYAEMFAAPLEALRDNAAHEWEVEDLVADYGEGVKAGEVFVVPLVDGAEYEIDGPGLDVVQVEEVEGPGGRRLDITLVELTEEELDIEIMIHHNQGSTRQLLFTRPVTEEDLAEMGINQWRTTAEWAAGRSDDQRHYNQHMAANCYIGCGSVAWGMLFGWGDKKAADGHYKWSGRWGLYRKNGGRGADAVAPENNEYGVRQMHSELARHMGTYCVINNQAATNPWDMHKAWRYLTGRTGTTLSTDYNALTISEDRIRRIAAGHIIHNKTPSIIGTGFVASAHYPMAWKYRIQTRTVRRCFFWCWNDVETRYEFHINKGWGGNGDGWIPADTWFAGTIYHNR
ncbi:MAG: hypothetical protein ACE366_18705 [Bradymonadia bacterium]